MRILRSALEICQMFAEGVLEFFGDCPKISRAWKGADRNGLLSALPGGQITFTGTSLKKIKKIEKRY